VWSRGTMSGNSSYNKTSQCTESFFMCVYVGGGAFIVPVHVFGHLVSTTSLLKFYFFFFSFFFFFAFHGPPECVKYKAPSIRTVCVCVFHIRGVKNLLVGHVRHRGW
jgi:hypothetical protein